MLHNHGSRIQVGMSGVAQDCRSTHRSKVLEKEDTSICQRGY